MIAWQAVEDALRTWTLKNSALPADRVFFADQDLPIAELSPRLVIRLGELEHVGQDTVDHTYDALRPAGEEIEITAKGMRILTVELQAFAPETVGSGLTARAILATAQAVLSLPSVRTALNDAGLGLLQQGVIQRIPMPRQATQEDRAIFTARFAVAQSVAERLTYIEKVEDYVVSVVL